MALETVDKLHAIAQIVPVLEAPFTENLLSSEGFVSDSFVRNGPGDYTLKFVDPVGFSQGLVRTDLGANLLMTAGAQILEDGSGVRITVFDLAGAPADPNFIGVGVVAVQQSEGAGPAVPPPTAPVGAAGGLPLSSSVVQGPALGVLLTPGVTQLYNTLGGQVEFLMPLGTPGLRVGAQGVAVTSILAVSFDATANAQLLQNIASALENFTVLGLVTMQNGGPDNTSTLRVVWEYSAAVAAWLPVELHRNIP